MIRGILLFLVTGWCAAQPPAGDAGSTLPVFHTGRLMGYMRYPDRQTLAQRGCPANLEKSDQVKAFLEHLDRAGGGDPLSRVLVGVGDNFAPAFDARVIYRDLTSKDALFKDMLSYDPSQDRWIELGAPGPAAPQDAQGGLGTVAADNVACFLRLAGYDALVPGKHDFYFGPERLRQIARFLVNGEGRKVHLLATNLVISTSVVNRAPRLPDYLKRLPYRTSAGSTKPDLPAEVLPWLREVKVRNAFELLGAGGAVASLEEFAPDARITQADGTRIAIQDGEERAYRVRWKFDQAHICPAKDQDPDSLALPGEAASGCQALERAESRLVGSRPTTDAAYRLPGRSLPLEYALVPGKNYAFCLSKSGQKPFCVPFHVHNSFFLYPHRDINHFEGFPEPYVKKTVGDQKVAVFGVLDQDFREHIGALNYRWDNANQRWDTSVVVADPVRSLEQLLQFCELDEQCRDARKILLAQMPADRAALLGVRFAKTFELIIAQTDNKHATGEQTLTQRSAGDPDFRPTFLAVPAYMYNQSRPGQLEVLLRKAELTRSLRPAPGSASDWTMEHRVFGSRVSLKEELGPGPALGELLDAALKKHGIPQGSASVNLQRLALDAMRRLYNADVAMLQRRDLFAPVQYAGTQVKTSELQAVFGRVFWKGDFVLRVEVTGSTLKALMQRSSQFDEQDASALELELEAGRGLVTLGILQDPETGQWMVNGEPVADGRLYALAVTDYLALGDTGYPELQQPAVPRPMRPREFKTLSRLSSLLCHAVASSPGPAGCGDKTFDASGYFDPTTDQPSDTAAGFTPRQRLLRWPSHGLKRPTPYASANALEYATQMRPVWSVTLDRLEGAYSLYRHNSRTEAELASKFAGVPVPQVTSPASTSLSSSARLRIRRAGRYTDLFGLAEESYARQFTRQADNAYLKDQKANLLAFEGGFNPRLWPFRKQAPDVKGILSLRFETQLADPIILFRLASGPVRRATTRTADVFGKLGARFQNSRSWLEGGYQRGWRFAPETYFFSDDRQQRLQHGAFLNFRIQVPLPVGEGRAYVMENRGDLFFNRATDFPVDTRYLDLWTHYLVVPLVGNLSLVPKLEFLFYQNKVLGNSMRGMQTSVGLQYRFEWRQGLPWLKVLRYPNPASQ